MSETLPSDPIIAPPPPSPSPPLSLPPLSRPPLSRPPRGEAPSSQEIEQLLHSSNPRPRVERETSERVDEKCWTKCRQTNARRLV